MTTSADRNNLRIDAAIGTLRPRIAHEISVPDDMELLRRQWAEREAIPVLLPDRLQGVEASWAGLDVRTLLTGEQSAGRFSAHDVIMEPGAVFPRHYHDDVSTYVLVSDGALEVYVGDTTENLVEDDFVFAPARTRLGLRNASSEPCRFVLLYAAAGMERAFEAAHACWIETADTRVQNYIPILSRFGFRFDDQALDNDTKINAPIEDLQFEFKKLGDMERLRDAFARRAALPRIVKTTRSEIEASTNAGQTFRKSVLRGDDSGGEAMVNVLCGVEGMQAPPHHQPTEEEFFFVGRGELEVVCGTETILARKGAFAFCPRNCTHGFRVLEGAGPSRFTTLNSPAGHERALAEVRKMFEAGAPREEWLKVTVVGGWIVH